MKFCETIKLTPADIEEGLYLTETSKPWRTPEHTGTIFISKFITKLPHFK